MPGHFSIHNPEPALEIYQKSRRTLQSWQKLHELTPRWAQTIGIWVIALLEAWQVFFK